jgi:hypothetical protein
MVTRSRPSVARCLKLDKLMDLTRIEHSRRPATSSLYQRLPIIAGVVVGIVAVLSGTDPVLSAFVGFAVGTFAFVIGVVAIGMLGSSAVEAFTKRHLPELNAVDSYVRDLALVRAQLGEPISQIPEYHLVMLDTSGLGYSYVPASG